MTDFGTELQACDSTHCRRAVREYGGNESEYVAVRVKEVGESSNARHVSGRQRFAAAEFDALRECGVDIGNSDDDVASVDRSTGLP